MHGQLRLGQSVAGLIALASMFLAPGALANGTTSGLFDAQILTPAGPRAPWGKAVADINGDGYDDVIVAGHQPRRFGVSERLRNKLGLVDLASQVGQLIWYEAPEWTPHEVAGDQAFRTDVAAADMDADGDLDLVALADSGVWLYVAPDWSPVRIDKRKFHDVALADLYGNGTPEIVLRNQSLFGYDNGDRLSIYTRALGGEWSRDEVNVGHGEGLVVADIDGDGRLDLVVNATLLLNRGGGQWQPLSYAPNAWPHSTIAVGDMNSDGRLDVVLAPAEAKGQRHHISWFEAPVDLSAPTPWVEHIVLGRTEAVHHALVAADFDRDGHVDLATAQMNQGEDPDAVLFLRNRGGGEAFETVVLGEDGSHNVQLLDADGDFDLDIIGANWQRDGYAGDYPVALWRNVLPPRAWRRYVIDADRPGQATDILAGDVDGDGWNDLVTGAFSYLNPGALGGNWRRKPLGDGANNAVVLSDLDADGDLDVLAGGWRGYQTPSLMDRVLAKVGLAPDPWAGNANSLALARNDGDAFAVSTVIEALPHDWIHGTALDADAGRLYLSLHEKDSPLYAVTLPGGATAEPWRVEQLATASENEALSLADLNGDGQADLVTGTGWVDTRTGGAARIHAPDGPVDRHVVADVDGDGTLDVIVGYESPDRAAAVAWYRRGVAGEPWTEHVIGTLAGPMSLDAGDVDLDGDIDVVVGEHRLARPELSRLVLFENLGAAAGWRAHQMSVGDEHHDGARLVDLDGDGDLDVASIGWTHGRVLVFENPSVAQ